MEIIDLEPEIQEIPNAKQLTNVKGEITFEEVGFRYQDDYENILNQISFQAQPGEYLALVGSSGVGKTTLCSLIPRYSRIFLKIFKGAYWCRTTRRLFICWYHL